MTHPLLKEIFTTQIVTDKCGNAYPLKGITISPNEGEFIWSLIKNNDIKHSIEIGCAFGISSLYICDALSHEESPHHVIIDPYQSTYWQGVGLNNLEKAKFDFYELVEKPSEIALPVLLEEGRSFDLAFIDGDHSFEHAFLDFFYLDRLLSVQGIMVFDDAYYPSVKKVITYIINNYPNYKIMGAVPGGKAGWKRRSLNAVKMALSTVVKLFPEHYLQELLDDSVLRSDTTLRSHSSMIALQKISHLGLYSWWSEKEEVIKAKEYTVAMR